MKIVLGAPWGEELQFDCTGRRLPVHSHVVGIRVTAYGSEDPLEVFGGYDNTVALYDEDGDLHADSPQDGLTPEECAELADFMVATWQAFKAARGGAVEALQKADEPGGDGKGAEVGNDDDG